MPPPLTHHIRRHTCESTFSSHGRPDAIAFQLHNALECCASDRPPVPLVESDYQNTYALLRRFVENDWKSRDWGDIVRSNLERSILSVRCVTPLHPYPFLPVFLDFYCPPPMTEPVSRRLRQTSPPLVRSPLPSSWSLLSLSSLP